jgi:predicted lactoylglutathione lyase
MKTMETNSTPFGGKNAMKFICLGYMDESQWDKMPQSQQDQIIEECLTYDDVLKKGGNWIDEGAALQSARAAKTLRWENGKVIVTDGPFAETKELLGGFCVIEARDMGHAVELMSKHPGVRLGGPFEIRPVDAEFEARYAERQKSKSFSRKIFVNLAVKDLNRSMEFFRGLGFEFNLQFTDETAACMVISEHNYAMLLTEPKFAHFNPKELCDSQKSSEVLIAIDCESREAVDAMVKKAVAGGGKTYAEPTDYGFMYQHGFQDPDGHVWEVFYMNPEAIPAS